MVDFFSWQAILGYIFVIVLILMVTGFDLTEFIGGLFEKTETRGELAEINKAIEELPKYKDTIAVHVYFNVIPNVGGIPFQAEGDVLIGETAVKKYSVGKKVFVRFDPQNPKWAVLDTERNRSIE